MKNNFPDSLILAYYKSSLSNWNEEESKNYYIELEKYLGEKKFSERLEQARVCCALTRMAIEKVKGNI